MKQFLPDELPVERVAACVGLISDTHMPQRWAKLPTAVFDVLHGVDALLHAGDLGKLWVLDQLSAIAPVIAVHGNDDTTESQQNLPFQQVITVAGQRILLWHSHYPDRAAEMASRQGDELVPKLQRSIQQAKQAGASVVVFGHWHIPLVYQQDGITVINPGAIASGNFFTRQMCQTVALLFIRDDGMPFVVHVDLAAPDQPHTAWCNWEAGFRAAMEQYNASILSPELKIIWPRLHQEIYPLASEPFIAALGRVGHRCWSDGQAFFTIPELWEELEKEVWETAVYDRLKTILK
jgi:hypothetical protein